MAELAAQTKAAGKTLFDRLESLYWQHGYHGERQFNLFMEGSAGMARMQTLMAAFRKSPPAALGGLKLKSSRDYLSLPDAPKGDMVIFHLAEPGTYVAIRPSGTEPKIKFYLFTFVPAEQLHLLEVVRTEMDERLHAIEADLRTFAASMAP